MGETLGPDANLSERVSYDPKEPDWDAVALHTASAVRAEVLILSCTPGVTGQDIIGAVIREAKNWCADGIRTYREMG